MFNVPKTIDRQIMKQFVIYIMFFLAPLFAQDVSWYDNPSSPNVFEISNEDQLKGFRLLISNNEDSFAGKTVKLVNDIVLTGNWTPIGNSSRPFYGTFDGQGYTISGLSVEGVQDAGLFGRIVSGKIKNVKVVGSKIKSTARGTSVAGGLAANYNSTQPIENCSVQVDSIVATDTVTDSEAFSGGLVGRASLGSGAITIANSYATANITGNGAAGGLLGEACGVGGQSCTITISNSYAMGNVMGNRATGGLVGTTSDAININNSYTTGKITSRNSYSGGLVGYAMRTSSITNSYAVGDIAGNIAGGLVGGAIAASNFSNSYVAGNITGNTSGGIFGSYNSGTITSVYYKSEEASQAAGQGSPLRILAVSSDDLKKQETFTNWDFNTIWGIDPTINDGYPHLRNAGNVNTPIHLPQIANSRINVQTMSNAIILQNLPTNAKVEVYNLHNKLISSKSLNQVNQGSGNLKILVQTKGIYIVKVNTQAFHVAVR
jgi:hypothetical protein